MKLYMTRELARAASMDVGNRSMRVAGRTKWSRKDYNASVAEFDRLWPLEVEYPWASEADLTKMRGR